MKLHYDPETDSLYIDFNARPGADAREIVDGLVVDFDEEERPVGIDIQHASRTLDLSTSRPLDLGNASLAGAQRQAELRRQDWVMG